MSPPIIASPPVLRAQRWGLWDVAITLGLALVLGTVASIGFVLAGLSVGLVILGGAVATFGSFIIWPLVATTWRGNGPRLDLGLTFRWPDVGWGVVGGFAGLILTGIAAWLTFLVVGDFNSAAGELADELAATSGPLMLVTYGLIVVLLAPFAEELMFRGLMFSALLKRGVPPWLVVLITAAAFAVFHLEPTRIGLLFVAGVVLGYIRMRTGSLTAPIVAHMVINAPAGIFFMFGLPELPGMTP